MCRNPVKHCQMIRPCFHRHFHRNLRRNCLRNFHQNFRQNLHLNRLRIFRRNFHQNRPRSGNDLPLHGPDNLPYFLYSCHFHYSMRWTYMFSFHSEALPSSDPFPFLLMWSRKHHRLLLSRHLPESPVCKAVILLSPHLWPYRFLQSAAYWWKPFRFPGQPPRMLE